MIEMSESEAQVFECMKQGKRTKEIAEEMGRHTNWIRSIIAVLVRIGAIKKTSPGKWKQPAKYKIVCDEYKIISRYHGITESVKWKSVLTEAQKMEIARDYDRLKRQELAKKLKIPKVVLNFEIEMLREQGYIKGA